MNKLKFLAIFAPLLLTTIAIQAYITFERLALTEYSYFTSVFFLIIYIFYTQIILSIEKVFPRPYKHILGFSISLSLVMAGIDFMNSVLQPLSSFVYFLALGIWLTAWTITIYSLKAHKLSEKHKKKFKVSYWKDKINKK